MRRSKSPALAGFTLVEVIIVFTVLAVLSLLLSETITRLTRSQAYRQGQANAEEVADRVIRGIEHDATFAAKIFTERPASRVYLDAMDFPVADVLPGAKMPVLTGRGYFEEDPSGVVETGNLLFMACAGPASKVETWTDGGADTATLRIDTFYFVVYYLTRDEQGRIDLASWGSVRVANQGDIAYVTEPGRRSELLIKLLGVGVAYAWDPLSTRENGLFRIEQADSSAWLEQLGDGEKLPGDPRRHAPGSFTTRRLQVAKNGALPQAQVPLFATPDPATGFPGGFEIKIDGPTSGKLMLLRLVLSSTSATTMTNHCEVRRYVSCRGG